MFLTTFKIVSWKLWARFCSGLAWLGALKKIYVKLDLSADTDMSTGAELEGGEAGGRFPYPFSKNREKVL